MSIRPNKSFKLQDSISTKQNNKEFKIETDNDDILPVSYVIEDTLKKY